MKKGIFWYVSGGEDGPGLVTVSVKCSPDGTALEPCGYSSKSGDGFNHRAEWTKMGRDVTGGHPFDHYPRGRVEIRNGKATVYLSPYFMENGLFGLIYKEFGLDEPGALKSVALKADGSRHYRYGEERRGRG